MSNKTELLKKLRVLSEQGVGGEKANAEAKLKKLMRKYNITEEELSEDITSEVEFKYHGEEQKKLLCQIIYKVTNTATGNIYTYSYTQSGRRCRTIIGADVTKAQKIEIEFLFDFYVTQWEKERKMFLEAFIQKHDIFGELKPGEKGQEMSLEKRLKMSSLINGMEDVSPVLRLEE